MLRRHVKIIVKIRRFQLFFMAAAVLSLCSCDTDLFELYEGLPKDTDPKMEADVWSPSECGIDEVVLESFSIRASLNREVLADIYFNKTDGRCQATVEHYKLAMSRLVPTWNGTAARVTVNGVDQIPGKSAVDFSSPVTYRFYASDGKYSDIRIVLEQGECSELPVMSLTTEKMVSDRYTWVMSSFRYHLPSDGTFFQSEVRTRLLYDDSFYSDKKSFDLEFDRGLPMLGMAGDTRWALISNVPDRTYLRNKVAGRIGSVLDMAWNPSSEYCELFVNNVYQGLYLFSEQVTVGEKRVNVTQADNARNPEEAGYLFRMDWNRESHWFQTAVMELPVNIVYPSAVDAGGERYVRDFFKKIEQYLYRKEQPDTSFRSLVDMESFAKCWIAYELTVNGNAAVPSSVWYSKDAFGKLCAGPLWSLDANSFNESDRFILRDYETSDFYADTRSLWYSRLFRDTAFVRTVKDVWEQHREELKDIVSYVDEQASVISGTVGYTLQKWPTDRGSNKDMKLPWKEAVDLLKRHVSDRWTFLDKSIASW